MLQQQYQPERRQSEQHQKVASGLVTGVLYGAVFGILSIPLNLIYTYAFSLATVLIIGGVLVVLATFVYVFAGFSAGRQTGKASRGLIAGACAGAVSFLIGDLFNLLLTNFAVERMRINAQSLADQFMQLLQRPDLLPHYTDAQILQSAMSGMGAIFVITLIGLVLGLIGGYLGSKNKVRVRF